MKLDTDGKQVEVKSSSAAPEAVLCGFDPEGTQHLMRLLSDLYKDAASSVLREYSINAYDSHKQAGNPAPIEVTLPSDISPTLVITDHGVGLSREELIEVYSRYGASTKRGTNDQVGAFGLGAKSAFTLGQQFMVTAVKNGWKTVAVFSLNKAGVGTVTILGHDQTEDPNGVSVSISIDKPRDMQIAVPTVFSTWPPGSVLVNGKQPWSVLGDSLAVTKNIVLAERNNRPVPPVKMVVVMGNIGYPVSYELANKVWREWNNVITHSNQSCIYAFVEVGDVDIAPSREAMRDTQRTLDRIKRALTEYGGGIVAMINRELSEAPTHNAAARRFRTMSAKWGVMAHNHTLSWRGKPIPVTLNLPYPGLDYFGQRENNSRHYHGYQLSVASNQLDRLQVITDVPRDKVETAMRAAKPYLAGKLERRHYGDHVTLIFVPPGGKPAGWFEFGKPDTFPVTPFDEYLAVARANTPKEKIPVRRKDDVQYQTRSLSGSGWRSTYQIAEMGLQVVVSHDHEDSAINRALMHEILDGVVLVHLEGGRTQAALERKLGKKHKVIPLRERTKTVIARLAKCSPATGCAARTPDQILHRLEALRDRITHPAVLKVLDAASAPDSLVEAISDALPIRPEAFAKLPPGLHQQFPLLQAILYTGRSDGPMNDHLVSYLNKVPRRRKGRTTP